MLFSKDVSDLFEEKVSFVENSISKESEDYILNVGEEEYINHLIQASHIDTPFLDWDGVSVESHEKEISEYSEYSFRNRDSLIRVKRSIYSYYVPISGNYNILNYHQARIITIGGISIESIFRDSCLVFEFVQRGTDMSGIVRQYNESKAVVISSYSRVLKNIESFNSSIQGVIRQKFNERKQRILARKNQLASLGVPIRKANTSDTFNIPKPTFRTKIEVKPVVTEKGFVPEPNLSDEHYKLILKYINDVGKNFERLPSLYKGKREEHLRDHILMVLDPNFEMGSATGETFNQKGKTDIMLNHNGQAVFISECKYWTGEKGYAETIDQLLSYLTWRNSKASIVIFVKESNFSSIIAKAVAATKEHPNYLGEVNQSDEAWYNFRFHLNGDPNRELKLALQLFHLPKKI